MNRKTASASEDLVGRYKDSSAATIIGERTKGSGCGYTDGGIELKLKYSSIPVRMPDCTRFLRNGVNEVQGLAPDIEIPMEQMNSEEFTVGLKEALFKSLSAKEL